MNLCQIVGWSKIRPPTPPYIGIYRALVKALIRRGVKSYCLHAGWTFWVIVKKGHGPRRNEFM